MPVASQSGVQLSRMLSLCLNGRRDPFVRFVNGGRDPLCSLCSRCAGVPCCTSRRSQSPIFALRTGRQTPGSDRPGGTPAKRLHHAQPLQGRQWEPGAVPTSGHFWKPASASTFGDFGRGLWHPHEYSRKRDSRCRQAALHAIAEGGGMVKLS